jgi:hypothetical protein
MIDPLSEHRFSRVDPVAVAGGVAGLLMQMFQSGPMCARKSARLPHH